MAYFNGIVYLIYTDDMINKIDQGYIGETTKENLKKRWNAHINFNSYPYLYKRPPGNKNIAALLSNDPKCLKFKILHEGLSKFARMNIEQGYRPLKKMGLNIKKGNVS